jgi:hypothetical protein
VRGAATAITADQTPIHPNPMKFCWGRRSGFRRAFSFANKTKGIAKEIEITEFGQQVLTPVSRLFDVEQLLAVWASSTAPMQQPLLFISLGIGDMVRDNYRKTLPTTGHTPTVRRLMISNIEVLKQPSRKKVGYFFFFFACMGSFAAADT